MPEHIVFGAGLIGGFIAGVLTSKKQSVASVARPNVREKLCKGLVLSDYCDNKLGVETLSFIDTSEEPLQPKCRYLWLTIKCTALDQALAEMQNLVDSNTIILCCQNGLGSDLLVKQAFPNNPVIKAVVQFNVAEIEAGHLHRGSEGAITLERLSSERQSIEQLAQTLDCPILPINLSEEIEGFVWAKLQLNMGNALNALADIPVKAMLEQRNYRKILARLMMELLALSQKKNIRLAKLTPLPSHWIPRLLDTPDWVFKILANKMLAIDPTVKTSMWWDLHLGKKTEVDFLNGAIAKEGDLLGLDCPANRRLSHLVHQVERGERRHGISAETLLKELLLDTSN